ncbi:MAG: hypothetical protein K2I08_05565 [Muribaculaceae bacterium]|nr:hypothetical protein [Muribaculaceae bacterium]
MEFKEIVKEWQMEFPILSKYTTATLMARTDIFLIGLRLDRRWSEMYDVVLEILPLWVPKEKIIIPVFREYALNKKGIQIGLECKLHDPLLPDYVEAQKKRGAEIDPKKFELQRATRRRIIEQAMECVHEQFDYIFQENVGLSTIFNLIKIATSRIDKNHHHPNDWFDIFELELALAYYFYNEDLIFKVKLEIEKEYKHWEKKQYDDEYKEFIKKWKADLYRRMEDRKAFMRQVEMNLSLKKISKLKQIHIHDDMERGKTLLQKLGNFLRPNK